MKVIDYLAEELKKSEPVVDYLAEELKRESVCGATFEDRAVAQRFVEAKIHDHKTLGKAACAGR
jgi:hypothetical protein